METHNHDVVTNDDAIQDSIVKPAIITPASGASSASIKDVVSDMNAINQLLMEQNRILIQQLV